VVKLTMTLLADPEEIIYRLMENPLIRQVGAFNTIRTPTNLALALRPHLNGTSQSPPAGRLEITLIFALIFRLSARFLCNRKLWGRGSDCYGG
jgi:hypothetical protein